MEQRGHFVMRKQRRLVADWTVKITGQIGNWLLQATIGTTQTAYTVIHPRTATLMLTGIKIEIETTAQLAGRIIKLEETNLWIPHVNIMTLFRRDTVNTFHHLKQTAQYALFREVRAQLFIADRVQMLFLFFAVVGDIPRFQLGNIKVLARKLTQFSQLLRTLRTSAFG